MAPFPEPVYRNLHCNSVAVFFQCLMFEAEEKEVFVRQLLE